MARALLDVQRADDAHTAARLRTEPIIWLGTTRPDGRPHHVPVWFLWADPVTVLFSMPAAQKVRNIGRTPSVALTLDSADSGRDIVLAEGRAEVVPDSALGPMTASFAEKYSELLTGQSFESWRATFSVPVLVTVSKVVAWTRKEGQLSYRAVP